MYYIKAMPKDYLIHYSADVVRACGAPMIVQGNYQFTSTTGFTKDALVYVRNEITTQLRKTYSYVGEPAITFIFPFDS